MIWYRIKKTTFASIKLVHVFWQLIYGIWRISKVAQPIVSIFGGARFPEADVYFKQAHTLAERLVEQGISVLTGGGPGIMQAASCGAIKGHGTGKVIGIGVKDLNEEPNTCVQEYFELDYFFARKWLLINYSQAFIIFPGGYGTMDELFELLTLIQTNKLARVPIILIGKEYWRYFMQWLELEAVKHGLVRAEELSLFTVTDDLEQAYCLARDTCTIS